MKIIKLTILFVFIIISNICIAQNYKIVDIVSDNFPRMEVKIQALHDTFNIKDFEIDNIQIIESNNEAQTISSNPPWMKGKVIPLSLVIALDISGSMSGKRLNILKASTKELVENLPLEIIEVAIVCFNNEVVLSCDFTHDINRLTNCIDQLRAFGGTSFNSAFLSKEIGLIDMAKEGQFTNKVITFVTDGMSGIHLPHVRKLALRDSISINCITIDAPISKDLESLCYDTGGSFKSNVNSEQEIADAYDNFYIKSQGSTFGSIIWESAYSYSPRKSSEIKLGKNTLKFEYEIPEKMVGKIEVSRTNLNFKNNDSGNIAHETVGVKGNNIELNITSIENTNPNFFGIEKLNYPITSKANTTKMLQLSFTPKDSTLASTEYIIKNTGCPDVSINASSEGNEQFYITHPIGKEKYVKGQQIPIKWDGISRSTTVDFYYQVKNKDIWNPLGFGTGFRKDWTAPPINDSIRIKGKIALGISFDNIINAPVSIIDGSSFKSAIFNESSNEILSLSSDGIVKNWDAKTGKLKHTFENNFNRDYAYIPNFNRVVSIDSKELKVYTSRNGMLIKDVPLGDQKNVTSLTHIKDKELYVTFSNFNLLLTNFDLKYIDVSSSSTTNYTVSRTIKKLDIHKSGAPKKEFSIKLDTSFQKSVLHRTKAVLAISNTSNTQLYNLSTKKLAFNIEGEQFYQFSNCSRFLITKDSLNYHLYSLKNGNRIYSVDKKNAFTIACNNALIAEIKNDSLTVSDIASGHKIWSNSYNGIRQYQFFPKSDKFIFLQKDTLTVINLDDEKTETNLVCPTKFIKAMDISPDEKSLLITCDNVIAPLKIENLLTGSSLEMENQFNSDISAYFKVVWPEPELAERIEFPQQYLKTLSERTFGNVIKNPKKHTIYIDSIYVESDSSCFSLVSSPSPFQLKPNEKSDVEIRFTPQKAGINTGKIIVVSGTTKHECSITGKGIIAGFEHLSPQIKFPAINVNLSTDTVIPLIKNTGNTPLIINKIRLYPIAENNFSLAPITQKELQPKDTLWAQLTFSPVNRGRQNTSIQIQVENQNWTKSCSVLGEGLAKRKLIIAGKTIHAITQKPLKSQVKLIELNSGSVIYHSQTDTEGTFSFEANTDLNYSIDAHLNTYFSSSENINLKDIQTNDTIWVTIKLMPIKNSATIQLNNIFFESGKADLLDISKSEILRIVDILKKQDELKLEVHGHTDNIGHTNSNKELSRLRALAVKTFITECNISSDRISIKYFGESQPIENNETLKGRKANRRVEIRFIQQ